MDFTVLSILALTILFIVLLILAGVIWFVRRRRSDSTAEGANTATDEKIKSAASEQSGPAGQKHAQPSPAQSHSSRQSESSGQSDEKIRILIVDDNLGTRENVSRLLYFEQDMEVIGQAVNGREGVEAAARDKPHIVLMDINMPDMDGITATREMSTKAPFSQVIIMSVQSDQHYMKQAMAAGARDFQPKPFTSEELVSCIRRVYQIGLPSYRQFESLEKTKSVQVASDDGAIKRKSAGAPVIAVYSPKGGVGTSAVAANLAVALHQERGGVVLMDGDLQFGDVAVHLNTKPVRTITDLIHDNNLETDLVQDILIAHNSGIKLLLAPPQPQLADIILPDMIKEVVEALKRECKIIVLDTTNKLTEITLSMLETAEHILVITTPELPAVKSTKLFLELTEQLEFDPDRVSVVINQANMPGAANLEKIERVMNTRHTQRIPYDPKVYFALNKGISICQQDPKAPAAQAFSALAKELLRKVTLPDAELEVVP